MGSRANDLPSHLTVLGCLPYSALRVGYSCLKVFALATFSCPGYTHSSPRISFVSLLDSPLSPWPYSIASLTSAPLTPNPPHLVLLFLGFFASITLWHLIQFTSGELGLPLNVWLLRPASWLLQGEASCLFASETQLSTDWPLYEWIRVVQLPSHVWLFVTPWTPVRQASLSLTISWSWPKFMSIAAVMPSSHLILWYTLLLRVPWTARRSSQLILKETNSEPSLERLILKLKLQDFCNLIWTANSLEKFLMLGKIEDRREKWIPIPFLWSLTFSLKLETWEHQFILLDEVLLKSPGNKWSCRGNCWSGSCLHFQAHLNYSGSHF